MARAEKALSISMGSDSMNWQDEDIFLTQLFRRATLLNDLFQSGVKETLLQHQVGHDSGASLDSVSDAPSRFERAPTLYAKELHREFDVEMVYKKYQSSQDSCQNLKDDTLEERIKCQFKSHTAFIGLFAAPVKTISRMREKVAEYALNEDTWPYSANILDPVRASIVCDGPNEILESFAWFESRNSATGLRICRVKNKFAFKNEELVGGYRDLMVSFVFEGIGGLNIIGEIQFHDRALHYLKRKVRVVLLDPVLLFITHALFSLCIEK
jgi:hypothetical protein